MAGRNPTPAKTNGNNGGKAPSAYDQLKQGLDQRAPQFKAALPQHITYEAFKNTAMLAVARDQTLLNASKQSLFTACMNAAQDGLMPDGREAAFVQFKDRKTGKTAIQYMPMMFGILKKVRQSGELDSISAHVVYENDHFEYVLGDDERIEHKPVLQNRGQPIAAYAIAKLSNGIREREVMPVEEIEKVRQTSRSKDAGPWKSWWSEMARKTVIRRLAKRLPMSSEADQAIRRDDDLHDLSTTDYQEQVPAQEPAPAIEDQSQEGNGNGSSRLDQFATANSGEAGDAEPVQETAPVDEAPPHDPETGEVHDPEEVPPDQDDLV